MREEDSESETEDTFAKKHVPPKANWRKNKSKKVTESLEDVTLEAEAQCRKKGGASTSKEA